MGPPGSPSALSALSVLVLDLETTGLDVRADRAIQVAAVAMRGEMILDSPRLEHLVDPGVPIPAASTEIHGLRDADVAGAGGFPSLWPTLGELIATRVVVGHHIGFDLAVLRAECERAGIELPSPLILDLTYLVGALEPSLPDLGFERVAALLGVPVTDRHRAMGDCLTTARMFARLLPRLRAQGVRTLGEALVFAARREDLARRAQEAGWYQSPAAGTRSAEPVGAGLSSTRRATQADAYLFSRRVEQVMSAPPATISPAAKLREAAVAMVDKGIGALLVGVEHGVPAGIVTERDLLRAASEDPTGFDEQSVDSRMSYPVVTIEAGEILYRALGRMDRHRVRHLCVAAGDGVAVGILSQRDLLEHRARAAYMLGDALEHARDPTELAEIYARLPEVAQALINQDLSAIRIAQVVSNELRIATARAAQLALAALVAQGRGPAPAPWCLLVLGSGGRGESLLGADQDNALIYDGAPDNDAWFAALGEEIAATLDIAGIPRCLGGVMAANGAWRGTPGEWRARVDSWLSRSRPEDLLSVDIFFDLTPVAGEARLAERLHRLAVRAASTAPAFLGLLAESVGSMSPPFSYFGGWRRDESGRVDLKRAGLLPLVSLARTLALRVGSQARTTPERLRAAADGGRLAPGDLELLIELHRELLDLVLAQQLADLHAGVRPSGRVVVSALGRRHSRALRTKLHRLDEMLRALRGSVGG